MPVRRRYAPERGGSAALLGHVAATAEQEPEVPKVDDGKGDRK
jgi:hypothetical protein